MPKYKITADGHLVLDLDKGGNVKSKKRLGRGDTVTMSEADAERLVRTGGLVLASEAEEAEGSEEPAATPEGQDGATDGQDDGTVDYSDEDEYQYSDLQALAKERGLNAGGSREDLEERLTEYDEAQRA